MKALALCIIFALAAGFGGCCILWSTADYGPDVTPPGPRLPAIRNDVTYNGLGAADWLPVAKDRGAVSWEGLKALTALYNVGGREALIHMAADGYLEATERLVTRDPDLSEWSDAMFPAAERFWRDSRYSTYCQVKFIGCVGPAARNYKPQLEKLASKDKDEEVRKAAKWALARIDR